jgi:hypothetical protein
VEVVEEEEVVEIEEEKQDRDEEFRPRLRLKQEQGDIQKWHSDYIQLTEYSDYAGWRKPPYLCF